MPLDTPRFVQSRAEVVSHKANVIYSAPVREIVGTKTSEETFATESE